MVRSVLLPVLLSGLLSAVPVVVPLNAADAADAAEGDEGPSAPVATGRLALVLDASGSMAEPVDGRPKIEIAREALHATVDDLPDEAVVGMRVFGATVEFADQPGACTDTQSLVPVGPLDRGALRREIDAYAPFGETPIGNALLAAAEDLDSADGPATDPAAGDGQRSIVLVSDGEPTCAPDPCEVAARLADRGFDLRIDVVGLAVGGEARRILQCVAAAGGGTYYDADEAGEISDSIDRFAQRAFRPFGFDGEPVDGAVVADTEESEASAVVDADAPEIGAGVWLDELPPGGARVLYRIPRTVAGSVIRAGVTAAGESGINVSGILAEILVREGDGLSTCRTEVGTDVSIGAQHPLVSTSVASSTGAESATGASDDTDPVTAPDPCAAASEVYLAVAPARGSDGIAGQPMEVAVYEEPPLADPLGDPALGPVPDEPTWRPMRPERDPEEGVLPGSSLADAPVLTDGSYALDINGGETQVVAVPLGWGETLQAQVDVPVDERLRDADAGIESGMRVKVVGPLRDTPDALLGSSAPEDWTTTAFANLWTRPDIDNYRTGVLTPVVAWANREESNPLVRGHALAGLRYVEVNLSLRENLTVPYTLTLRRYDDPTVPEPGYAAVPLPAPSSDSPLALQPAEDDAGDGAQAPAAGPPVVDATTPGPWVFLVGLATVAALIGIGALFGRRRS